MNGLNDFLGSMTFRVGSKVLDNERGKKKSNRKERIMIRNAMNPLGRPLQTPEKQRGRPSDKQT